MNQKTKLVCVVKSGKVQRVPHERAARMTNKGWSYCPKKHWKNQDDQDDQPVEEEQEEQEEQEQNPEEPVFLGSFRAY